MTAVSDVPAPAGHYSHAVQGAGLIFVSGQLPQALAGQSAADVPFESQVGQVLKRVIQIVEAWDSRREKILKVSAFIVGVENWPAFNQVYAEVFGEHRPARSVIPVPALHYGWLVEVEAIAAA